MLFVELTKTQFVVAFADSGKENAAANNKTSLPLFEVTFFELTFIKLRSYSFVPKSKKALAKTSRRFTSNWPQLQHRDAAADSYLEPP